MNEKAPGMATLEEGPKITRRAATAEDTDFARRVHHEGYHDTVVRQFGEWDEAMQDEFFDNAWNADPHEVMMSDERDCGYCAIERHSDHIFLHELVVSNEFQRQGIGSKVLRELIDEAKSKGIPVKLQVLRENVDARRLYTKLGFKDTETTDMHYMMEYNPADGE